MQPSPTLFRAVCDPTRRGILDRLAQGDVGATQLRAARSMSQPAMSQHLKVLREAGLVSVRTQGRRRIYSLQPDALRPIYDWIRHYERFWDQRLDRLGALLDEEPEPTPKEAAKEDR